MCYDEAMEITQYTRGHATKTLHVKDAESYTNQAILELCMERADENASSLFGTNIRWVDDMSGPKTFPVAIVSLYTD